MKKRCKRRVTPALPPRGLRPRLASDQVRDLGFVHVGHLDDLAYGRADGDKLWQWLGGLLTWHRVAQKLQRGVPEMDDQLALAQSVMARFGRTGRMGFSGAEYQLAKRGVMVMDQLAEQVDRATAIAAAEWSELTINRIAKTRQPESMAS